MGALRLPRLVRVEERRRERGIGGARRLAQAEACSDRAGLRDLSLVQAFDRSLKSGLRHVAEGACLVPIDRERLVVEQDLAEPGQRSEEHTSELQSHSDLVCRLLLLKKK